MRDHIENKTKKQNLGSRDLKQDVAHSLCSRAQDRNDADKDVGSVRRGAVLGEMKKHSQAVFVVDGNRWKRTWEEAMTAIRWSKNHSLSTACYLNASQRL